MFISNNKLKYKSIGAIVWVSYPLFYIIEDISKSEPTTLKRIVFSIAWVFLAFGLISGWNWAKKTIVGISYVGFFVFLINSIFNISPEVNIARSILMTFYFLFTLICANTPKGFKSNYEFIINTSVLAMASLISGGISFLNILANKSLLTAFLLGVPAIIFGGISLKKLGKEKKGTEKNILTDVTLRLVLF